jgi:hypothetical protein
VYQSTKTAEESDASGGFNNDESMPALPELLCSKSSRLYSADGGLKQGCTSFFTLQRFGTDEDADADTEETEYE